MRFLFPDGGFREDRNHWVRVFRDYIGKKLFDKTYALFVSAGLGNEGLAEG